MGGLVKSAASLGSDDLWHAKGSETILDPALQGAVLVLEGELERADLGRYVRKLPEAAHHFRYRRLYLCSKLHPRCHLQMGARCIHSAKLRVRGPRRWVSIE